MTTQVLLVRHGQSTWNAAGRWQGHADPPLTPRGEEQAALAAPRGTGIAAVWSSDLRRARRTAEIIAGRLTVPCKVDARLRERDAGEWTGLTRVEIEAGWPGALTRHERPPHFEPDIALMDRVMPAIVEIASLHDGESVLTVTHGGVVRAVERALGATGAGGFLPNLGGRWLTVSGDDIVAGTEDILVDADHVTTPRQL